MADNHSPDSNSGLPSVEGSRNSSVSGPSRQNPPRARHNVKFTPDIKDEPLEPEHKIDLPEVRLPDSSDLGEATLNPPRPAAARNVEEWYSRTDAAAQNAHSRASKHANRVKRHNSSHTPSRRPSFDDAPTLTASPMWGSPPQKPVEKVKFDDIPLADLTDTQARDFSRKEDSTDTDDESEYAPNQEMLEPGRDTRFHETAKRLVRSLTTGNGLLGPDDKEQIGRSGTHTPAHEQISHEYDYVPKPDQYKPSVLQMLLSTKLSPQAPPTLQDARQQQADYLAAKLAPFQDPNTDPRKKHADFFARKEQPRSPGTYSGVHTPHEDSSSRTSGRNTPRNKRPKWYKEESNAASTSSIAHLLASATLAAAGTGAPEASTQRGRASQYDRHSTGLLDSAINMIRHPVAHLRQGSSGSGSASRTGLLHEAHSQALELQAANIADRLASERYLVLMCRALMRVGAPTHRLEEYMTMAARKLCIQASFQYLPSCMIVSFDDPVTHTTELRLVKEPPIVDLGKMKDIQEVYKDVIHDKYSISEAMDDIQSILDRPRKFNRRVCILLYGIAAVAVGPFAFSARPVDFPIAFILGTTLGFLQLVMAARSTQFSHLFEVVGTCLTSLAARGFGSITHNGTPVFCFSALAQSSIALILPGWIILSAALELQSRNIIAGSIRMVYAIIYTLLLGFGILIGVTILGLSYSGATNDITCDIPPYWDASANDWRLLYIKFMWVPVFTICLAMINQAKWKQMPWMIFISIAGYQVNFWTGVRFSKNVQISNALGALTIGVLANLYSRFRHGVAAAAMLPAIFVMVPSGLAASGALVAGLTSAQQLTHNMTGISIINNGTQGFYDAQTSGENLYGGTIFNVGYGMVQVAIGISVGLFLSALVIYPFGKKRSGLFTL